MTRHGHPRVLPSPVRLRSASRSTEAVRIAKILFVVVHHHSHRLPHRIEVRRAIETRTYLHGLVAAHGRCWHRVVTAPVSTKAVRWSRFARDHLFDSGDVHGDERQRAEGCAVVFGVLWLELDNAHAQRRFVPADRVARAANDGTTQRRCSTSADGAKNCEVRTTRTKSIQLGPYLENRCR